MMLLRTVWLIAMMYENVSRLIPTAISQMARMDAAPSDGSQRR